MNNEELKHFLKNLPDKSGVYRYYNDQGIIIYVGKAKNLKRRVSSYFNKEQNHPKTRMLVSKIAAIKFTVTDSEYDALLLENNLIKKYQPRYTGSAWTTTSKNALDPAADTRPKRNTSKTSSLPPN